MVKCYFIIKSNLIYRGIKFLSLALPFPLSVLPTVKEIRLRHGKGSIKMKRALEIIDLC